jgi:hypothetical protein
MPLVKDQNLPYSWRMLVGRKSTLSIDSVNTIPSITNVAIRGQYRLEMFSSIGILLKTTPT